MERFNKEKSGTYGWAMVLGAAALWDMVAPESLSHAFKRGMEKNKLSRALTIGSLAVTSAHLLGVIPRKYDPFYLTIDRTPVGKIVEKHRDISD